MSEQPDINDMISISEAARIRNVSHGAIQDLIKREKLNSFTVGGRRLLSRKEVENFKPEPVGRPAKEAAKD
jgi:excisionase family DNA binding protein